MIVRRALCRRIGPGSLAAIAVLAWVGAVSCKNVTGRRQTASSVPSDALASTVLIDTGERQLTFRVEVARTEPEREKGLMYREHLAADAGMIFLFERPSALNFWMKNTLIPLDMIFIGADRSIVGIVAEAQPLTLTPRGVDEPSQYVLEIGGGLAARLGIRAGQHVEFHGIDGP